MKRYGLVITLLFVSVCAGAQGRKQLDSLKYILPEFTQGAVIYSDRQVSQGLLNISPFDQGVYCLSPKNDTLFVARNPEIISVSVSGRSFMRWKSSFVEIVARHAETGIGITRSSTKVNNAKAGAYGTTSTTSSIRSYAVDASSGMLMELIIDDPKNFLYTRAAYLFNKGKFLSVSKKSFIKMFPEQKDFIESVWLERNITSVDTDAVIAFYNELLSR